MRLPCVLPPVAHERKVAFDAAAKVVEVEDTVSADDDQQRNITLQWHFPKDKTLTIDGNQVVVTSPTGNRLTIVFEGDIPDHLSVAKGRKEDRVFSCISYKANQVEPSQVLRVMFKERRGLDVITRFRFALAEDKVAPLNKQTAFSQHTLAKMLEQRTQVGSATHSVMLGNASVYLALARSHREQGLGHVSLLVNDSAVCENSHAKLKEHYLSTWLSCRPLAIKSAPPVTADKAALKGLEGIARLIITPTGFAEKHLTTVLLTMLPPLLKRMTKAGEVWVSADLSDALQALCITWAEQRGLAVSVVAGLDAAMEVTHD